MRTGYLFALLGWLVLASSPSHAQVMGAGRTSSSAIPFQIGAGQGTSPGASTLVIRGHNTDVDTGAPEDLVEWGGTAQWYTAAELVSLTSTSASDDGAIGQGAKTVLVSGLDANGDSISEIVTLNGLSDAETTLSFLRVNQLTVATCGTLGGNVGAITAAGVTSGYTLNQIDAGDGISHSSTYTIPNGKVLSVTSIELTAVKPSGSTPIVEFRILARTSSSGPWLNLFDIAVDTSVTNFLQLETPHFPAFGEGVETRTEVETSANNTEARIRISGLLVSN